MSESLLIMAKDLALAQVTAGHTTPDNLTQLLQTTDTTLQQLQSQEQIGPAALSPNFCRLENKHHETCDGMPGMWQ